MLMGAYQHILAAIDLDANGERVLQRAKSLADAYAARLSVVHVVEYVTLDTGEALIATPVDLTREMVAGAQTQLTALCEKAGVPASSARVLSGPVALEILNLAQSLGVDLIAVGHQPRKGFLSALFSHTEENVVSKAPCDVLALKLPQQA
jgi:universal stress protein A